jgi:type IV secretion system protein TrbC
MKFESRELRRKFGVRSYGRIGKLGGVAAAALSMVQSAHAATNTSLTMLETPLQTLQKSLQGPVALAIGIIAVAITGGMLIFGGEISDFGKRMAYVVLVLAILLTANTLVPALFSTSSAVIF